MKRLLIILFFLPFFLFSQEEKDGEEKNITVGINYSANVNFINLRSPNYFGSLSIGPPIQNSVRPIPGFNTGVTFGLKLNKRVTFDFGLQYSELGYELFLEPTDQEKYSVGGRELYETALYSYDYKYITVPVKMNLNVFTKKLSYYVGLGYNFRILHRRDIARNYFPETTFYKNFSYSSPSGSVIMAAIFNFGVGYTLNDRIKLKLEPTLNYGLLDATFWQTESKQLHSAGINFRIDFDF